MPLAEKKGALGQLGQMLPAGFEIVERGQREQRTAPDPVAAQLREALQASFDIIARLAFADDVAPEPVEDEDRKSVVSGKSVSVRVELVGRRHLTKKNNKNHQASTHTNT